MKGSGNNASKPLTESERIKQLLVRVGDDGPNFFKRDIDKLSSNLFTYYQKVDQNTKENVLDTLAECVSVLPHKASIYATVVAMISLQTSALPEVIIDKVLEKLKAALDRGDIYVPKATLIFLGELLNVGLFNRFIYVNILFDLVHEAEKNFDTSLDYYLQIAISVIPYVVDNLREKNKLELNSLIQNIEKVMGQRERNYLKVIGIRKDQKIKSSRLDMLWNALKDYIESGKKSDLSVIFRPYEQYVTELANVKELKKSIKIQLASKDAKFFCFYQSPPLYYMFDEKLIQQEIPSVIDLAILREKIADFLTIFNKGKKMTVHSLLQTDETFNCTYLIIESIFSEMFNLPVPNSKVVYYTSVLISLINEAPQPKKEKITKLIHEGINMVFTSCANYDVEILDRFADFFAHFISNFNFEWNWSSWKYVAESETSRPEAILLRHVLTKLVQISFYERVKECLPEELQAFLPSEQLNYFEYDDAEAPNHSDAEIIKDKLNSKPSVIEMIQFLKSGDNNLEASNELLLDIFVQCLLNRSSKTLTHFNAHLDKYHTTINEMITKEADQFVLMEAVRKFWKNSNFHVILDITTMETYKLLESKNIVSWIFKSIEKEDDAPNNFQLYWDLLFSMIEKNIAEAQMLQEGKQIKDKNLNQERDLETVLDEQQTIFALIFKRLHHLIGEVFSNNSAYNQVLINRLIQLTRKYRRELDNTFAKIEEDFSKLENPELQDALSHIRELKFLVSK